MDLYPVNHFFYDSQLIVCQKNVSRKEIDELYFIRKTANYGGYDFEIMGEHENQILLCAISGNSHIWRQLGFDAVGREVYQKWTDKGAVRILEEKWYIEE